MFCLKTVTEQGLAQAGSLRSLGRVYVYIHIHTYMRTHTYTHTDTYMHTYVYVAIKPLCPLPLVTVP